MVQQLIGAGMLMALGYVLGRDGSRQLVVCPCGPDGKPVLPDLAGQVTVDGTGVQEYEWDPVELHDDFQPRGTSTTYGMLRMAPAAQARALLLTVHSTLDQAVTVQVVGHTKDGPQELNGLYNIEASQSLAAGNTAETKIGLEPDLDVNRYPYLGVTIATGGTAPTVGRVQVYAYILKPKRPPV